MNIKIINIFIYFFLIAEVFAGIGNNNEAATRDTAMYLKNPLYQRRIEMFKISKLKSAKIVMLGNSLTEGGNWSDLLGRRSVANRGITGDILEGYLHRMEYVTKLKPKVCFIEGGINDIYNWVPVKKIYQNYKKVIEILRKNKIKPVIQSTLYTARHWGKEWLESHNPGTKPEEVNRERNREVDKLNALLREYARKNKIIFIDLNSKMSSRGFLKNSYTWDGAHLNAKGYRIWAQEVIKVLNKLGL
ncbi:MAG: hypothetical protein D6830_00430 [Ignavibacteria bacterium]|nr:MAG: hypothetical protein D6830_00430 [Ignavibacteria bacterium]